MLSQDLFEAKVRNARGLVCHGAKLGMTAYLGASRSADVSVAKLKAVADELRLRGAERYSGTKSLPSLWEVGNQKSLTIYGRWDWKINQDRITPT